MCILGGNGSGKSSITCILSTLKASGRGHITLKGKDLNELKLSENPQLIGFAPSFDYLQNEYTVIQHLQLFA